METLNFETVKNLFDTGTVYKHMTRNNTFCVVFTGNTKVYDYKCKNLIQLMKKLNIDTKDIEYKHNYNDRMNEIERINEKLDKELLVKESDLWLYDDDVDIEKANKEARIELEARKREIENKLSKIKYIV